MPRPTRPTADERMAVEMPPDPPPTAIELRCVMCDRRFNGQHLDTCPHCGFGKGIPNTGRDR